MVIVAIVGGFMAHEPASARPARFPRDYGSLGDPDDRIPWSYVEDKLRSALNYWVATVGPAGRPHAGRPHARPVDGVWVEGALCFGGSPETRWVRNLQANPAMSVNLSSEAEAIILEGHAELITDPAHPLAVASTAATKEKYPQYAQSGLQSEFHPFWALRPRVAYAWSLEGFPNRATRFAFES
jgi:pyridoxamine 5'-phosphate oxidase-like protein